MTEEMLPGTGGDDLQARHAHMWELGARMLRSRRWSEATDQFLRIIEMAPSDAAAMVQAAYLLQHQDRYREAHALAIRAARVVAHPVDPDAAVEIAKVLRRFEESAQLQALLAAVNWDACRSAHLLTEAARLLMNSGLHSEALAMINRAIVAGQGYPHAHYIRGSILAAAGEQEAAHESLQRARLLAPDAPHVHWMLSWQQAPAADAAVAEADIAQERALLRSSAPGSEDRAYLAYALHNRLHRLQRYDESWEALECGMEAKRLATPYRPEAQQQVFERLRAMQSPASPSAAPSPGQPRPIFIVGMHRSGTTLLERLLAGHSTIADGGETYTFTAQICEGTDHYCSGVIDATALARLDSLDWQSMGDGFRAYARWRAGGRRALTEKLPSNFLNVGLIARALPEARFLHMRRDPVDVCFSNLRTFFGHAAAYSYDQAQLADYYLQYQALMAHWHAQLPGHILDIDYAALVQDAEAEMRRVLAFCGLDFEPDALDVGRGGGSVATASMADVRSGISKDRGGAWKPYATRLQPLIEALRPALEGSSKSSEGPRGRWPA